MIVKSVRMEINVPHVKRLRKKLFRGYVYTDVWNNNLGIKIFSVKIVRLNAMLVSDH